MKKNILFIVSIATVFVYGMEQNKSDFWSVTYSGTKINLHKDCMSNVASKVDAIVLGLNQQFGGPYFEVGELYQKQSIIFEGESFYPDDDSYQPYSYPDGIQQDDNSVRKELNCSVFQIIEPCIGATQFTGYRDMVFKYMPHRPFGLTKNRWNCCLFYANQAIEEAGQDLARCYKIAFDYVFKQLDKEKKSIAFATLSADVGFPREKAVPIAVDSVVECIENKENNPGFYDCIAFVVTRNFEFALYKLLLMRKCGVIDNIFLLYREHKDFENIVSLLPKDLFNYIVYMI